MFDHIILQHLDLADAYAANADRIAGLKHRSRHSHDLIRRCREAAERERAEAAAHASFDLDPLVVAQEYATWQRLRQYSLDRAEALTLADVRWLRTVVRPGRSGSLNFRRAAELLCLVGTFASDWRDSNPPSPAAETDGCVGSGAGGGGKDDGEPPP